MSLVFTRAHPVAFYGWIPALLSVPIFSTKASVCSGILLVLLGVALTGWRRGVSIDPQRRTVITLAGPFMPFSTQAFRFEQFAEVALMEESEEVHDNRSSGRSYVTSLMLKLQGSMAGWDPHEPSTHPVVVAVQGYPLTPSGRDRGLADGRRLAEVMGLALRSDIADTGALPRGVDRQP